MPKLSYIEYKSGKRELLYGEKIPKNAESVVIETVTEEEFEEIEQMPMDQVKEKINNILDFKE